jgi:transposase
MRAPGIDGRPGTGRGCRKSNWASAARRRRCSDYLGAIDALTIRRAQLEATIGELAPASPWAKDIARLRCLRGIDTLTALGLCSEIGECGRFDHPDQLSAYLGIVPSEHTTGAQRRLGSITKAGSTHARRLLIEAAYH